MTTEVTIVRPNGGLVDVIAQLIAYAGRAWIIMLAIGALFPEAGISYWQTVLGLLVFSTAMGSEYTWWTKSPGWNK